MKYDINFPLDDAQRAELLQNITNDNNSEDETNVLLVAGQNPTLSEMMETIIWASDAIDPNILEFNIDSTYIGDDEYARIFAYLNGRGYTVNNPNVPKEVKPVPMFEELEVIPPIESYAAELGIEGQTPVFDNEAMSSAWYNGDAILQAVPGYAHATFEEKDKPETVTLAVLALLAIVLAYVAGTHTRK